MEIMHRKLYVLSKRLLKHSVNGTMVSLSVVFEDLQSPPKYSNSLAYKI